MLVPLIARGKATRVAQRIAPQFDKFLDGVKAFGGVSRRHRSGLRLLQCKRQSNRAHQPPSPKPSTVCASSHFLFQFPNRWSILLAFTDLTAVANGAFQQSPRFWEDRSIPGNYNDCDHNECRDQRKSPIKCSRAGLCGGRVGRRHDTNFLVLTYFRGLPFLVKINP
jgi:hypothetical protein